jgi:hypothetical protein
MAVAGSLQMSTCPTDVCSTRRWCVAAWRGGIRNMPLRTGPLKNWKPKLRAINVGYGPTLTRFHRGTIGCCILAMNNAKTNLAHSNLKFPASHPVDRQLYRCRNDSMPSKRRAKTAPPQDDLLSQYSKARSSRLAAWRIRICSYAVKTTPVRSSSRTGVTERSSSRISGRVSAIAVPTATAYRRKSRSRRFLVAKSRTSPS